MSRGGIADALHITNGDSTDVGGTGLADRLIVWFDVLHEGPVPAVDDDEFRRIRADHLTSTDTVAGVGVRARSVRSSGPDARCQPRRHLCAVVRS